MFTSFVLKASILLFLCFNKVYKKDIINQIPMHNKNCFPMFTTQNCKDVVKIVDFEASMNGTI